MKLLSIILFISISISSLLADTSKELKEVMNKNLEYIQNEKLEKVLTTMHTQSPGYLQTQKVLKQLFSTYDIKQELLNFNFIGEDEEYAYARAKFSTKKVSGPAFTDNTIDALEVFKKEDGVWKLWSQATLSIDFQ